MVGAGFLLEELHESEGPRRLSHVHGNRNTFVKQWPLLTELTAEPV